MAGRINNILDIAFRFKQPLMIKPFCNCIGSDIQSGPLIISTPIIELGEGNCSIGLVGSPIVSFVSIIHILNNYMNYRIIP